MGLQTLDLHASDAGQSVLAALEPILAPHIDRIVNAMVGAQLTRDGDAKDRLARRDNQNWVRVGAYGSWEGQLGSTKVTRGKSLAALCVALSRAYHGIGSDKEAIRVLRSTFNLVDMNIDLFDGEKTTVTPIVCCYPAPADFRVPTVEELRQAYLAGTNKEAVTSLVGQSVAVYTYTDAQGGFYFYNCRKEDQAHGTKTFIKIGVLFNGGLEIESPKRRLNISKNIPLYRLPEVYARPDAWVIVVEGEKTCEAAQRRFPDHVCITWAGGALRVGETDWGPLVNRNVVVFPDNDPDGGRAAQQVLSEIIKAQGRTVAKVGTRPVRVVVDLPSNLLPPTHDLGDPDPPSAEGWAEIALENAMSPCPEIAELNRRFVFVEDPDAGEAYVLVRNPRSTTVRGSAPIISRLSVTEFQTHFLNQVTWVAGPRGGTEITLGKRWLTDPYRATAERVVCDPTPTKNADPKTINVWRGFATTPAPGGWDTISRIIDALTRDQVPVREYLLDWCALMFQQPDRLPLVAIVIRSTQQGVGKSTFAQLLHLMVGQHAHLVTNPETELLGNFNPGVEYKVLLDVEELDGTLARTSGKQLMNLITSPTLTINQKNQPTRQVDNFIHMIITSNDEIVAPSGVDARRFLYLTMDARLKATGELIAFNNATTNARNPNHPELQGFLDFLLTRDISAFSPGRVPRTDDHASHVEAEVEKDTILSWLVQAVTEGEICGVPWPAKVLWKALEADYQRNCENERRHPMGRTVFRSRVRSLIFGRDRSNWSRASKKIVVKMCHMSATIAARAQLTNPTVQQEGFVLPTREEIVKSIQEETGLSIKLEPMTVQSTHQVSLDDEGPDSIPF